MSLERERKKGEVATDPSDFEAVAAGAGVVEHLEMYVGELLLAVADSHSSKLTCLSSSQAKSSISSSSSVGEAGVSLNSL